MATEEDDEFNPQIPREKLPEGWTVKSPYSTTVRLHAPNAPDHIIIQPWPEDGETTYAVTPLLASEVSGADAESDPSRSEQFDHLDNAVEYAVSLAKRLAN